MESVMEESRQYESEMKPGSSGNATDIEGFQQENQAKC